MDDDDRALAAIREDFPDWDIHQPWSGCYIAVPKGTPFVYSPLLYRLRAKLDEAQTTADLDV